MTENSIKREILIDLLFEVNTKADITIEDLADEIMSVDDTVKTIKEIMNWRKEPITEKQEKLIAEMCEMSEFPLEQFTGTTKGEASDWIDRNMKKAHETVDQYEATHE